MSLFIRRGRQSLWFLSLFFFSSFSLAQQESGAQQDRENSSKPSLHAILQRVDKALRQTNYRGHLTYEQSGKLEVMEVSHAVIDGIEYEKIFFLNGEDRTLMKHGRRADCDTFGGVLLSGAGVSLPNGSLAKLTESYAVSVLGEDRVAGRNAWVLQLTPKDEFRHALILAVDQTSYLPLKSMYVASGRKVLERVHFVSLETDLDFDEQYFASSTLDSHSPCVNPKSVISGSNWKPNWIPPGFVLTNYSYSSEDGHMETYTDGLASFSIFVRPLSSQASQDNHLNLNTNLKKGATIIVMRVLSNDQNKIHASLLGEIPSGVAGKVLSSVSYAVN